MAEALFFGLGFAIFAGSLLLKLAVDQSDEAGTELSVNGKPYDKEKTKDQAHKGIVLSILLIVIAIFIGD